MPRPRSPFAVLLALTPVWCAACGPAGPPADMVLTGGAIITLDPELGTVEALAVRDGMVVAAGPDEEIAPLVGPNTQAIELAGRTVVPGLADNHFHALGGGPGVDLSGARSLDQVVEAIRLRAEETTPGELIVTNSNWHEGQLAEQRLPLRDDLDRATSEHPVVVVRGGHEYILNSFALEGFEIGPDAVSPPGGRVGRYPDGRLNGELVDNAQDWIEPLPAAEPDTPADPLARLRGELAVLSSLGVTSIRVPGGSPELFHLYRSLEEAGELDLRVDYLFRPRGVGPAAIESVVASWPAGPDFRTELIRVGGVKLGVDGGFEGGWMREPYEEPWGEGGHYHGLQTTETGPYKAVVRRLNQLGWRVATHAVGDAAIDLVLEAYEEAHEDSPITGRRWTIEHGFIPAPDHFPRILDLGVTVTAQNHLYVAAPSLVSYWGADRAALTTPVGWYVSEGVPVSLGTDSPVIPYNPFWVLYHFATRGTISAGVMGAGHAVSRMDALERMTMGYAYQVFEERERGSLRPGMKADFAVLTGDYLTVPDESIQDLQSELTVLGGRVTYRFQDEGR
ncbi:MAG: amidohydrolase [Gemmatimonadetes bacterium]|nr:amidohydrolase [Gemmatimonadota bacterium]